MDDGNKPLRMAEHMELLGADYCEHNVYHPGVGVTRWQTLLTNQFTHIHDQMQKLRWKIN